VFVDELTIYTKAGKGGNGVERWFRTRYKPQGGPAGGNGGKGGDVYVRAVKDLGLLSKYTGEKLFKAEDGVDGQGGSKHGKNGADLYIDVPVGSTVTNLKTGQTYELKEEGEVQKVLRGGAGGYGNEYFKSSTNRTPRETTPGKKGEEADMFIELSLAVDIGLVGLPNAGKSTFLNELTNAKSQIGAYPFTTLEPHLGEAHGYIIADIPGLIEGAASGKGLGHKFLKHIRRTKMLLHLVSLEEEEPLRAYGVVQNELQQFDPALLEKTEWIVLTKSDTRSMHEVENIKKQFTKKGKEVCVISAYDDASIKACWDKLTTHFHA